MKSLDLKIADYKIRLEAKDESVLQVGNRFRNFLCFHAELNEDILRINVHKNGKSIPSNAEKVYNAVLSADDIIVTAISQDFWSVWKHENKLYLKIKFPSNTAVSATLEFSLDSYEWELWLDSGSNSFDPLEYPLDSLILYYLAVINKDIMIHASGIDYHGNGFLFSGVSGKGKTTMSQLWNMKGGRVIHDDRLIIRKTGLDYYMHNTPVYNNDEPRSCLLNAVYIIEHGTENIITQVKGAEAVSLVMANCIQHNWGSDIIRGLLESLTNLCRRVPVYKLKFRPDERVIDQILKNG